MVIDTSALLAILQDEPERRRFNEEIEAADSRRISVATWVESSIVIDIRLGAEGLAGLDLFVERAGLELVPLDREQAAVARRAFSRYGKGRHPAGLNYGDCFSYALASVLGEALLYKGRDFSKTDVASSPASSAILDEPAEREPGTP
jgi:ribonuclease VapC